MDANLPDRLILYACLGGWIWLLVSPWVRRRKVDVVKQVVWTLSLFVLGSTVFGVFNVNIGHGRHHTIADTRVSILSIVAAAERYKADCGACPAVADRLISAVRSPGLAGWKGPYLKRLPLDAWGNSFRYSLTNGVPLIQSAGPDMIFETADDITN